jgi:hypothetical protein
MKLYHGGMQIVENPKILTAHFRKTDFGSGFYTTSDYEQAKKWVAIRRTRGERGGYVSIFEAPDNLLKNAELKLLVYNSAHKEWLTFVMNNRYKDEFAHDYDIVAGPVANDRVYFALSLFEQGLADEEESIRRLKTYTIVNQILFHTEKALQNLTFGGSEIV